MEVMEMAAVVVVVVAVAVGFAGMEAISRIVLLFCMSQKGPDKEECLAMSLLHTFFQCEPVSRTQHCSIPGSRIQTPRGQLVNPKLSTHPRIATRS